jgi:hypothetical protein
MLCIYLMTFIFYVSIKSLAKDLSLPQLAHVVIPIAIGMLDTQVKNKKMPTW